MAAEDAPRCPACQRKQTLAPVPESEQLLIESNSCQYCRKLRKTFVDIPPHRPQFNRSASCPAGSIDSVVTYPPEGEQLIDFLTREEDKEEDANDSTKDVKIDISDASDVLPQQPAGRVSKQTLLNAVLCVMLVVILGILLYVVFPKHSPSDEEHRHHSPPPLNPEPHRNATGVPSHRHHCLSYSMLVVDSSKLEGGADQQSNVPFKRVNSTDGSVSLTGDGRTVIFSNPGLYEIDVNFIMDTYTLDSFSEDRSYKQNLCLRITGRPQVCRPLIVHRRMRMPLRVHADFQARPGQRLSVSVLDRKMLFPDPNGNILTIKKRFC